VTAALQFFAHDHKFDQVNRKHGCANPHNLLTDCPCKWQKNIDDKGQPETQQYKFIKSDKFIHSPTFSLLLLFAVTVSGHLPK
jgi:hypothetical protein